MPTPATSVEFFKTGFFGYGAEGDFKQWSLAHFLPIIFLIGMLILIYQLRNKIKNWKYEENFRYIFLSIMMLVELSYFWRLLYVGSEGKMDHLLTKLPLQLCQWTLFMTTIMMAKKSQKLFSMTFFLTMSVGLIPLFVPAVISTTGPTYWRYYQFWGEHILPIIGVYYMMFVHGFRPKPWGALYAGCLILALAGPAIYMNLHVPDASYLYLTNTNTFAMLAFLPEGLGIKLAIYPIVVAILFAIVWFAYFFINKGIEKLKSKKAE